MKAPFPYFGGKREVTDVVWSRLGRPSQYIEPFCGSAAVLLAAPSPAALEVVGDTNGFIANFWRATKCQPEAVAEAADYPVSHVDLGARHVWLMAQRERVEAGLQDAEWPGDAKVAGWWLWGQCSWIGSGWCEWDRKVPHVSDAGMGVQAIGQVPHVGNAGRGMQAIGKVPHVSDAGRGVQAIGQVPHVSDAGMGIRADGQIPAHHIGGVRGPVRREHDGFLTSSGRVAWTWLHKLADRLERVRVVHGEWSRCLNHHFGGDDTAVFLDPPYRAYEGLYGASRVADEVCAWAAQNANLRVALCGHVGDYDLPGWDVHQWKRPRLTYSGGETTDKEAIWFSPACLPVCKAGEQLTLGATT